MDVMIVTAEPLRGPTHLEFNGDHIWLRSRPSGLMSLSVDVLILGPGLTEDQRLMAIEKTRPCTGKIYELTELRRVED